MDDGIDRRIPVTLLTGFLGSGKTTLLKNLLRHPDFTDAAVLINEFGEIGLDHLLVDALDAEPVLLSNGCICCTIRGDVSRAIRELYNRRQRGDVPPFRRLLIETTGLADPGPIVATILSDLVVRHHFRVGLVVTTVDAQQGATALLQREVMRRQAASADLLVITKTDLVVQAETDQLRGALTALNPAATLIEGNMGLLDPGLVAMDAEAVAPRWLNAAPAPPEQERGKARSIVLTARRPIRWSAFGIWFSLLAHRHGDRLLRMKGVLAVEGSATPVAVHAVGPVVYPPEHMAVWPGDAGTSHLVLIVEGLDLAMVERSFDVYCGLDVERGPTQDLIRFRCS